MATIWYELRLLPSSSLLLLIPGSYLYTPTPSLANTHPRENEAIP